MRDIGLVAGMATAIGSLPHRDSRGAASLVLSCVPDLPAAPQLPHRTPLEGMISPWASAVPGVVIHADGTISLAGGVEIEADAPLDPVFSSDMHGSLLTFLDVAVSFSRFLDGGGWFCWGAIPTHRPVGENALPLWKGLLDTWCELTRRGCDPARLRTQALVAPACGLAGHGESQAAHAMLLAREIGGRVHGHAAACKLAVGA